MTDNTAEPIHQARVWSDERWTARVIKNEDDDGWAVAMLLHGESEPALVGPWTMGRDKKNPKPLDVSAFHTLVKTANEVLRRHDKLDPTETARRLAPVRFEREAPNEMWQMDFKGHFALDRGRCHAAGKHRLHRRLAGEVAQRRGHGLWRS